MKKFARITALMLVVIMSVAMLASCGISEKTAEKINKAVKDGEPMSVADVEKLCGGEATLDLRVPLVGGFLVWVSGCKDADALQKKLDEGKTPKALYVMVVGGKATAASFQDYDKDKK